MREGESATMKGRKTNVSAARTKSSRTCYSWHAETKSSFIEKRGWLYKIRVAPGLCRIWKIVSSRGGYHPFDRINNSDECMIPKCRRNRSGVNPRKLTPLRSWAKSPSPHNPITLIILTRSIISVVPFLAALYDITTCEISGHHRATRLFDKNVCITVTLRLQ